MADLNNIYDKLVELQEENKQLMLDLKNQINELHEIRKQNQILSLEIQQKIHNHTKFLHDAYIKDKSPEQQAKDFAYNLLANLAGNAIQTPKLLKL